MNRLSHLVPALLALSLLILACPAPGAAVTADESFDSLKLAFDNLYQSLSNEGGMNRDDRPSLLRLRERFKSFNTENPENKLGLTYELQLAIWLEDNEAVDDLFSRLSAISPDDQTLGMAWADYFINQDDYNRADAAYGQLLGQFPDNPEIRIRYCERLKERNLYARVIELMNRQEFDYTEWPEAAMLLSDSYFAQHRFEEAVEALETIPVADELAPEKQRIKKQADDTIEEKRQYIEYWTQEQEIRDREADAADLPIAQIITAKGIIVIELFENETPNTVANFISLAEERFYHGSTFHRVIPNFMAQGGDPYSKPGGTGELGTGNPGYYIADEHTQDNARKLFTGSVAMAKVVSPDSAGCQFFINITPTPWLNGKHTVFGRVVEGQSVVRQLEEGDRIETIMVIRKRDHEYAPVKIPLAPVPTPIVPVQPSGDTSGNDPD